MKKVFVALLLVSFLAGLVVPLLGLAQTTNCCLIRTGFSFEGGTYQKGKCVGEVAQECQSPSGVVHCSAANTASSTVWGVVCLLNSVYRIVDIIFLLLIVLAVVMGLAGAYNIVTAGGAAEKVNKGRDLIIYAIIGIIVAFFAKAIPSLIAMVV